MNIRNTQTEKNLLIAFAGELQARNKYSYFAEQAKKDGLEQIASIFEETSNQEKEHAKRFFSFLQGGSIDICSSFTTGKIGSTMENLVLSTNGEHYEWSELYPSFSVKAREEGFDIIAKLFDSICIAEKQHEDRYLAMLNILNNGNSFIRNEVVIWKCRNCGYIEESSKAPTVCPACAHPQSYFEVTLATSKLYI
jgi:rubrerythrin